MLLSISSGFLGIPCTASHLVGCSFRVLLGNSYIKAIALETVGKEVGGKNEISA